MGAEQEYQSPILVIIGGVSELTQQNKEFGNADGGITFDQQPTTIAP